MQDATLNILKTVLMADGTVTQEQRTAILKFARNGDHATPEKKNGHTPAQVYSFKEAARLLGNRSVSYVQLLASRNQLVKFKTPGSQRARGILASSLENLIANGSHQTTAAA